MPEYPRTAMGVLEYLGALGSRIKALDERVTINQRADSAIASNLGILADRMSRAQDRATYREYRDFAAERVQEAAEARERARRDAENCRKHQVAYSDSFASFGVQAPAPVSDERPGDYRRRLFANLQARLSPRSKLYPLDPDAMDRDTISILEPQLHQAAKAEGETPSYDNLPRDGSMVERLRLDPQTNHKQIEYFGRRSFIADMTTPGRRVVDFPAYDKKYGPGAARRRLAGV
jgi:hypothetical protein